MDYRETTGKEKWKEELLGSSWPGAGEGHGWAGPHWWRRLRRWEGWVRDVDPRLA